MPSLTFASNASLASDTCSGPNITTVIYCCNDVLGSKLDRVTGRCLNTDQTQFSACWDRANAFSSEPNNTAQCVTNTPNGTKALETCHAPNATVLNYCCTSTSGTVDKKSNGTCHNTGSATFMLCYNAYTGWRESTGSEATCFFNNPTNSAPPQSSRTAIYVLAGITLLAAVAQAAPL